MVIVDEALPIRLVNAQVESLFGYDRAELVGQRIEMLVPARFRGRTGATAPGMPLPGGSGRWGPAWTCTACAKTAVSSRSRSACPRWTRPAVAGLRGGARRLRPQGGEQIPRPGRCRRTVPRRHLVGDARRAHHVLERRRPAAVRVSAEEAIGAAWPRWCRRCGGRDPRHAGTARAGRANMSRPSGRPRTAVRMST